MTGRLSSDRANTVPVIGLLAILVAGAIFIYGVYATSPQTSQPRTIMGDLQLRSASVATTGIHGTLLDIRLSAVVYNPNPFGATLDAANYSVSANGHYVGSGQITKEYDLAPRSSTTFVFPVAVGWRSGLETAGRYLLSLGNESWEVNGTALVNLGGVSLSAPFEFTTG